MSLLQTAAKLEETRDGVRRLLGERWPAKVAELKPVIERIMRETQNTSPVSAVLPAAKAMSADGNNPMVLLAVAVEMSSPTH